MTLIEIKDLQKMSKGKGPSVLDITVHYDTRSSNILIERDVAQKLAEEIILYLKKVKS